MKTLTQLQEKARESFKKGFGRVRYEYSVDTPDDPIYPLLKYSEDFLLSQIEIAYKAGWEEVLKEKLCILPREFWEDEDHAVGGYISKKDLYELLKKLE